MHPATIRLFQMSNSSDIKDPNNGHILTDLKIKNNENLGAFKKSTYLLRKAAIVEDSQETGQPELTHIAK